MLHSVSSIKNTLRFSRPDVASLTDRDINGVDALDFLISEYERITSTPETLVKVEAWAMQAGGMANKALAKMGGWFKKTIKPIELKDVASKSAGIEALIKRVIQELMTASHADQVRLGYFIGVLVKKVKADSPLYSKIYDEIMGAKDVESLLVPELLIKLVESSSPYTDMVWAKIVEKKPDGSFYIYRSDNESSVANQRVIAAMLQSHLLVPYLKHAEAVLQDESLRVVFYRAAIEGFLSSGAEMMEVVVKARSSGTNLCELFFERASRVDTFNSKAGSDQSGGGGKKEPATVWVDRLVLDLNFRKADIQLSESSIVLRAAAGMSDNERKTNILRGCDSKKHSKDQLLLEIMGKNLVHLPAYLDVLDTTETGNLRDEICNEINSLYLCKIITTDTEDKHSASERAFGREFNGEFRQAAYGSVLHYFRIHKKEGLQALLQQVDNMSDKKLSLAIMKSLFRILPLTINRAGRELAQTILGFMPAYLETGDESLKDLKKKMVADCFMPIAPIERMVWARYCERHHYYDEMPTHEYESTAALPLLAAIKKEESLFPIMLTILDVLGIEQTLQILNQRHVLDHKVLNSQQYYTDIQDCCCETVGGETVRFHTLFSFLSKQIILVDDFTKALQEIFSLDDQHAVFRSWSTVLSLKSKVSLGGRLTNPESKLLAAACMGSGMVDQLLSNISSVQNAQERKDKFTQYFQATTPWGQDVLTLMFVNCPLIIAKFLDWIESELGGETFLELLMTLLEGEFISNYTAAYKLTSTDKVCVLDLVFSKLHPLLLAKTGHGATDLRARLVVVLRNPAFLKFDLLNRSTIVLNMILAQNKKPFPPKALQLIVENDLTFLECLITRIEGLNQTSKALAWKNILDGQGSESLTDLSAGKRRSYFPFYENDKLGVLIGKLGMISCEPVKALLIVFFFKLFAAHLQKDKFRFENTSVFIKFFTAHISVVNTIENRWAMMKDVPARLVEYKFDLTPLFLALLRDIGMPLESQLDEVRNLFRTFLIMITFIPALGRQRLVSFVVREIPDVVDLWRKTEPDSPYLKLFKQLPKKPKTETKVVALGSGFKPTDVLSWVSLSHTNILKVLNSYLESKTQGSNRFKETFCRTLIDHLQGLHKVASKGEKAASLGESPDRLFAQLGEYLLSSGGDEEKYHDMLSSDPALKKAVDTIKAGLRSHKPLVVGVRLSGVTTVVYGQGGGGGGGDPEFAKTEGQLPMATVATAGGGGSHDPEGPKTEEEFVTGVRL